jgi:hypothetical protein
MKSSDPLYQLLVSFSKYLLSQVLVSIVLPLVLIHMAVDHKREQDRRVLCYMEGRQ